MQDGRELERLVHNSSTENSNAYYGAVDRSRKSPSNRAQHEGEPHETRKHNEPFSCSGSP